jgi:hypothetical protein
MLFVAAFCLLTLSSLTVHSAAAQQLFDAAVNIEPLPVMADDKAPPPELFPRGTREIEFTGQYIREVSDDHEDQFAGGSVGLGYYFFDRIGGVVEVPFYDIDQRHGAAAVASGITLLARIHLLEIDRFSLFGDIGAGALLGDNRIPAHGTNFNFTPQAGLGFTYRIAHRVDLIFGSRYFHLSNAGIDGRDHNPSINAAMQGYVGLLWQF